MVAIKRAGKTPTSKWTPSNSAVVCGRHFVASDYASVTYHESKHGVKTKTITADFSSDLSVYEHIRAGLTDLQIGVLVNNVGMSYDFPDYFLSLTDKTVADLMAINMMSVTMMTKLVLPSMVERKKGVVINMSSYSGSMPTPLLSVYSACKAYVDFFSRCLHAEYKSKGIFIQSVMPHMVTSKISKIRHPSMRVPSPANYVNAALVTVGTEPRTFGYWEHALEGWIQSALPDSLCEKLVMAILGSTRKRALKKKAMKQS